MAAYAIRRADGIAAAGAVKGAREDKAPHLRAGTKTFIIRQPTQGGKSTAIPAGIFIDRHIVLSFRH